ncbi:hypothetical protein E6Q11_02795 [Candidatus Dojkabacteria bacterium]|uniref:Uncharacterized protein n=1 Tax=Candidatus Dojkabacteria bacterium TaxID=2099670 RepID=A0A5C7JA66_9BACT|nr:MAG: hypothetical protein E6Q11_02795 [Candidatus Dojkabacteria bacterium]
MNSKELLEAIHILIKARDTNGVDVQTVIDFLVKRLEELNPVTLEASPLYDHDGSFAMLMASFG